MAGVENRPGQGRAFGQPVFQQFEPGGTDTPGNRGGERRGRELQFNLDNRSNLAGSIREAVAQARAEWRGETPFNAAWFLHQGLQSMVRAEALRLEGLREIGVIDQETLGGSEKMYFFGNVQDAWKLKLIRKPCEILRGKPTPFSFRSQS